MIAAIIVSFAAGFVTHVLTEHALIARERAKIRGLIRRAYVVGKLKGGPMYGIDLADPIILPRSSLYVHLARMEEEGAIVGYPDPSPVSWLPPRRMYRLPTGAQS